MTGMIAIGVAFEAGRPELILVPAEEAQHPLDHHRAVVASLRRRPMAPLRHGASVSITDVNALAGEYRRIAELSRDHVEIGVSLIRREAMPTATTGRGFLRAAAARQEAQSAFRRFTEDLAAALTEMPGVVDVRILAAESDRAGIAVLGARREAPALAIAIDAMSNAACGVSSNGPWPLYSFTPQHASAMRSAA